MSPQLLSQPITAPLIEILDDGGDPYVTIHEAAGTTNILVATDTAKKSSSDTDFITTAVLHEIDTVLIKQ